MPSLHIGKKRVQSLSSSDPTVTIAPGSVTAGSAPSGGVVSVSVDPTTNDVTITGVGAGTATVTYNATGFKSAQESFTVSDIPTLVVTDGPEQ